MQTVKNVTVAIDDEIYRRARIRAAEQGTSVSAMVAAYLRDLSAGDEFSLKEALQDRVLNEVTAFRASDGSRATRFMAVRFVDTNVLLYAVSREPQEQQKVAAARTILRDRDLALSTQVLQEFYVQATRANRPNPLTHGQAAALVESFTRFRVQETTLGLVRAAMEARQRFQLSSWDAAVLEAARLTGCDELLSEDLNDGQDFDGVRVVNPFR